MTSPPKPIWTGPDGEPSLADIQREFPDYDCWRGVSGLYHARPHGQDTAHIRGEDPRDLRDQINRHIAQWIDQHAQPPANPGQPPARTCGLTP